MQRTLAAKCPLSERSGGAGVRAQPAQGLLCNQNKRLRSRLPWKVSLLPTAVSCCSRRRDGNSDNARLCGRRRSRRRQHERTGLNGLKSKAGNSLPAQESDTWENRPKSSSSKLGHAAKQTSSGASLTAHPSWRSWAPAGRSSSDGTAGSRSQFQPLSGAALLLAQPLGSLCFIHGRGLHALPNVRPCRAPGRFSSFGTRYKVVLRRPGGWTAAANLSTTGYFAPPGSGRSPAGCYSLRQ